MSSHALDNQMEERLFKELLEVKQQVRDLRTLQIQGSDAVPQYQYTSLNGIDVGPFSFITTIAASGLFIHTVAIRHGYPVTTINGNNKFEPSLSVRVDTNDPVSYLWPSGGLLSTGQKKLMVSVVRDWQYGLTPQDPQNNAVYHIQLHNLDSASHTYYCTFHLYGDSALQPFVELVSFG